MFQNKNYWDICRTNQANHDTATQAVAGSPICWPRPSFWPIGRRSLWAEMHGHPWIGSMLRWGGCGCCCSAVCACAVTQLIMHHEWSFCGRHARPTATTRHWVCVRLITLFWSSPYWPSESTHGPTARRSNTAMPKLRNLDRSNINLVATLIRRLVNLRPHKIWW